MSRGRVLVVDDDPRWQNTLRRFLESEGFSVATAADYNGAMAKLESECFHVIVVDIRLVDWDTANDEGLQILAKMSERGLDDVTQKIVVTGYGTTDRQRAAFAKYGVLDFIPKEGDDKTTGFDRHEFIRLIESAFSQKVKVNPDLDIQFTDDVSLPALAGRLAQEAPVERIQQELTDLLDRLFYDMSSIVISPVASGHSSSCLIEVEPYCSERGRAQPVIVKIDLQDKIRKEEENFDRYVHRFIAGNRHTDKERVCYTLRFGGIVYSLLGYSEHFVPFGDYYRTHDATAIGSALRGLFQETCRHWYENRGHKRRRNLSTMYRDQLRLDQPKLEQSLRQWFGKWLGQSEVVFSALDLKLPNPVYSPYVNEASFALPVFVAATHGDLNASNLLVDSNDHVWLIDFYHTGEGHILRDFIKLEATIKFELLEVDDLTLLYDLESALLAPTRLDEQLEFHNDSGNPDLAKAFATINDLRSLAFDVLRPDTDLQEYYVGLFYETLKTLTFHSLLRRDPKSRRQYVLLSAAMLSKRLESWK